MSNWWNLDQQLDEGSDDENDSDDNDNERGQDCDDGNDDDANSFNVEGGRFHFDEDCEDSDDGDDEDYQQTTSIHPPPRRVTEEHATRIFAQGHQHHPTSAAPNGNSAETAIALDDNDDDDDGNANGQWRSRVASDSASGSRRISSSMSNSAAVIVIDTNEDASPLADTNARRINEGNRASIAAKGASGLARPWNRSTTARLQEAVTPAITSPQRFMSRQTHRNQDVNQIEYWQSTSVKSASSLSGLAHGTAALMQQRKSLQRQRNDIRGGSGAGAGGFGIVSASTGKSGDGGNDNSSIENYSETEAQPTKKPAARKTTSSKPPTSRNRRKPAARTKQTAQKKTKKSGGGRRSRSGRGQSRGGRGPGGFSGGRRGSGRGRGGRWNSSSNQVAGGGVWGNDNEGGWQVSEAFTTEDPAMQNIGGVQISF